MKIDALFRGYGYAPIFVEGKEPQAMHQKMAAALNSAFASIRAVQQKARNGGKAERPISIIVLRSPKGWTGRLERD